MSIRQIAALPYRTDNSAVDAPIRIMLITSRETKRWVIPKGNIGSKKLPHSAAAQEAEEEAGILGSTCPTPLGSFRYRKKKRNGASIWIDVDVFPFAVTEELTTWDEQHERERRWFSLEEAADAVVEEAPDDTGHEEQPGLAEEDERDPLVVADHLAGVLHQRHGPLEWHIVSVAHPADCIGVILKKRNIIKFAVR
jgi:8-oxo-dGTP pyrophosphatase MutT (NUDIX family)